MMETVGYVVVPNGIYKLSSITIDKPIHFAIGGALSGDQSAVIDFCAKINAPTNQYIFQGDAAYNFKHTISQGEDSRQAHVAWFGAQVVAGSNIEQSDYIQKALTFKGEYTVDEVEHFV